MLYHKCFENVTIVFITWFDNTFYIYSCLYILISIKCLEPFLSFSFILYRREFRFRRAAASAAAPCLNATNASHDFSSDRDVYPWEEEAADAVIFLNKKANQTAAGATATPFLLTDSSACSIHAQLHRERISIIKWNKNFFCCVYVVLCYIIEIRPKRR